MDNQDKLFWPKFIIKFIVDTKNWFTPPKVRVIKFFSSFILASSFIGYFVPTKILMYLGAGAVSIIGGAWAICKLTSIDDKED